MMKFGFGQPVTRKEDEALLRGAGRYVGDFAPKDTLHAAVLRSPHAHARFRVRDVRGRAPCPELLWCSAGPTLRASALD